jgi:uncharacterized protein
MTYSAPSRDSASEGSVERGEDLAVAESPRPIHNVHSHVFTVHNVPRRFLPLGLVGILSKSGNWKLWDFLIRHLPRCEEDARQRLASFCRAAEHDAQEDILKDMMGFYPSDTRFALLSMDFDFMEAGSCRKNFISQLDELRDIKKAYGERVLPFMAIDPRRPGLFQLARKCIEEYGFAGFKLYPPLGYFPFDQRLDEVYAYAEAKGIPVTTHCSHAGPFVYWRGRITEAMRERPKPGKPRPSRSLRSSADIWANPRNYESLLAAHPGLKLNLGHAGGEIEWRKFLFTTWPSKLPGQESQPGRRDTWLEEVIDLIGKYDNVYADISYTASDPALLPLLKVLLADQRLGERFLFGSDSYMVQMDTGEREFGIRVRATIGEDLFEKIAIENPMRWLT